jgi:hypothetical protein
MLTSNAGALVRGRPRQGGRMDKPDVQPNIERQAERTARVARDLARLREQEQRRQRDDVPAERAIDPASR